MGRNVDVLPNVPGTFFFHWSLGSICLVGFFNGCGVSQSSNVVENLNCECFLGEIAYDTVDGRNPTPPVLYETL